MSSHEKTDVLPLLALKVAPRQFDVSYRFSNISIRDQIVRAQMLVRTLAQNKLLDAGGADTHQLLICGAGISGIAAAMEAERLRIRFVLIDSAPEFPAGILNSKARRYVSTGMYEWPHPSHANHEFPLGNPILLGNENSVNSLDLGLSQPELIADFADAFLRQVGPMQSAWADNYRHRRPATSWFISHARLSQGTKKELRDLLTTEMIQSQLTGNPLPSIDLLPLEKLQQAGEDLDDAELEKRRLQAGEKFVGLRVEYIVYAAGFARESSQFAEGKPSPEHYEFKHFWDPDQIDSRALGFPSAPSVAVLGSGDGALQDTLRCLIRTDWPHPLAIWDRLMAQTPEGQDDTGNTLGRSPEVHHALRRIAGCDAYTTGGAAWSKEKTIFGSLDNAFRDIAGDLLRSHGTTLWTALRAMLRHDVTSVSLLNRYGYFSKAYALNRFLVYLIDLLMRAHDGAPTFEIVAGEAEQFTVDPALPRGGELKLRLNGSASAVTRRFDLVIIRGGLDRTFGQQVGLSGRDTGRAELGRIPPPIRPVAIP